MSSHNNLPNYRKMQEPLEAEEATEALKNFFNAVEKARNEFHIMDVHVLVKICVKRDDSEGHAMSSAHFGNTLEGASMCAWGLGQEQAELNDLLHSLVKGK